MQISLAPRAPVRACLRCLPGRIDGRPRPGGDRSPAVVERRRGQDPHRLVRSCRDRSHGQGLRRARGPGRGLRQRRHALVRAAGLLPGDVRHGYGEGHGGKGSSARGEPGDRCSGQGRLEGARRGHCDHAREHDERRIRRAGSPVDEDRATSDAAPALHGTHVPADARVAGLPRSQRLLDLDRLGWRRRVHARIRRGRLWHSARARHRIEHQDEVRGPRRQARDRAPAGDRVRRRQGRQARRDPQVHRQAADHGFRQFGRRLPDARVDDLGARPAAGR